MFTEYQIQFKNLPILARKDLEGLKQNEVVIVDVRTQKERNVSIIPNSISKEDFERKKESLRDKKIVAYCTIGYRSGIFAAQLKSKGFHAYNLKGSILGWIFEGGSLVTLQGEVTKKVHVYGSKWNLVPDGFEAIY